MKNWTLVLSLVVTVSIQAQITETDNTMLWTSFGISKKLDDDFRLSYYQLSSISFAESRFNFIQPDLNLSYEIDKNWDAALRYTPTFSLDGIKGNQLIYHRVSADVSLNSKIGKRIRIKNSITAEQHFSQRSKFKQRYYFRFDIYYRNKKWPWRLRPFATQKLYWYDNGKEVQYYDQAGNPTVLASPDGLHAYRIKTGIKLYPFDDFNFSIYFQKQKEFNTSLFGSRDINSLTPNSVSRPFYDFSVIGISCSYNL